MRPPKPNAESLLAKINVGRCEAAAARESFIDYLKIAGRTENGERLILDPPHFRSAQLRQQAYFEGKDYCGITSRGSLKTTLDLCQAAWMIGRDPNLTGVYATNTEDLANQRCRWFQSMCSTDDHKRVFRDAVLLKSKSNASQAMVRGKTDRAAPNLYAKGIDGARSGYHMHFRIVDDVCDTKSSLTQPARKGIIKQIYHTSMTPLLIRRTVDPKRLGLGITIFTGTAYAPDDLNAEIDAMASGDVQHKRWYYERIACGGPPDFETPYPSILSSDDLRQMFEENERAYRMNYMLQPILDGERPFRRLWWYLDAADGYDASHLAQFASHERLVLLPYAKWPRLMTVDPGFKDKTGNSRTGITIGTMGPDGTMFTLRAMSLKQPWDTTVHQLPELYQTYRCSRMLVEDAAQQSALVTHLRDLGVPYVEGIGSGSISKEARAAKFASAPVCSGMVRLKARISNQAIVPADEEMQRAADDLLAFPGLQSKDWVDSFVYMIQAFMGAGRPGGAKPPENPKPFEVQRLLAHREACFGGAKKAPTNPEWDMYREGTSWN